MKYEYIKAKEKIEVANLVAYKVLVPISMMLVATFFESLVLSGNVTTAVVSFYGFFTIQFWIVVIIRYKSSVLRKFFENKRKSKKVNR